jgi:hypothetical protein
MSQVDDLRAQALQNSANDVDRRIVAIKQTGRSDHPNLIGWPVTGGARCRISIHLIRPTLASA